MECEINSSILNNYLLFDLTILKARLFENISEPAFMLFLTMPYYCLLGVVQLVKLPNFHTDDYHIDFIFH